MSHSSPADDIEQLTQRREEYVQAENAGDVEGILRTFADDVVLMPPGSPPVEGIDAAGEFLEEFLDAFSIEIGLTSEDIVVEGDVAYDWGTVSGTLEPVDGDPQPVSNTYLLVYQRESDGVWRQTKHIWNENE